MSFNIINHKEISSAELDQIFKKAGVSEKNTTSLLNCVYAYYSKTRGWNYNLTVDDILEIDFEKFCKVRCVGKKKLKDLISVRNYLITGVPMKKEKLVITTGIDTSKCEDKTSYISLDDVKGVLLLHIKELKEKDDEIRKELDQMFPGIGASESIFSTYLLIASAHKLTTNKDQLNHLNDLEKIDHENKAKYFILENVAEDMKINLEDTTL